jgi:CheY-like chemotaxis protein
MKKFKSILIIDDDQTNVFLSRLIIEDLEIAENIYEVFNGEEALKFIEEALNSDPDANAPVYPDLILLDINMPVMNGFEFLDAYEQIKPISQNSPAIVMLTSSNDSRDIDASKKYDIIGYINKPLSDEKLQQILKKISIAE